MAYYQKTKVKETIKTILSLFTIGELRALGYRDEKGKYWSFRQQVEDRFGYQCPSIASLSSIKVKMQTLIDSYRPIIRMNAESVRKILLNEMSNGIFVNQDTHLWNLEVLKNLDKSSNLSDKSITKLINKIIEEIRPSQLDLLVIHHKGESFTFKEQLLARWRNAWKTGYSKDFSRYLKTIWLHSKHSPKYWSNQPGVINVEVQAFLQEMDRFFLYPKKYRKLKWLMGRDDHWEWISRRKIMHYLSIYVPEEIPICLISLTVFLIVILC